MTRRLSSVYLLEAALLKDNSFLRILCICLEHQLCQRHPIDSWLKSSQGVIRPFARSNGGAQCVRDVCEDLCTLSRSYWAHRAWCSSKSYLLIPQQLLFCCSDLLMKITLLGTTLNMLHPLLVRSTIPSFFPPCIRFYGRSACIVTSTLTMNAAKDNHELTVLLLEVIILARRRVNYWKCNK